MFQSQVDNTKSRETTLDRRGRIKATHNTLN